MDVSKLIGMSRVHLECEGITYMEYDVRSREKRAMYAGVLK
jgi:hypothetical protein